MLLEKIQAVSKLITVEGQFSEIYNYSEYQGYFSLLWAGTNPSARVVAVEASPRNIGLLRNNVKRNRFEDRVTVIPKAAGDHAGRIAFDAGPAEQTGWGGISRDSSANTITVPMVRIDEELRGTDIELLKIDVEGADTLVLLGCEGLLQERRIRTIYFEQNRQRMEQLGIPPDDAVRFLRDAGYECRPLGAHAMEWIAFPRDATDAGLK